MIPLDWARAQGMRIRVEKSTVELRISTGGSTNHPGTLYDGHASQSKALRVLTLNMICIRQRHIKPRHRVPNRRVP